MTSVKIEPYGGPSYLSRGNIGLIHVLSLFNSLLLTLSSFNFVKSIVVYPSYIETGVMQLYYIMDFSLSIPSFQHTNNEYLPVMTVDDISANIEYLRLGSSHICRT